MEPQESGKALYYIVWNPWWNTTFYLSTQAKIFNLGGVKYKWYRTWHNWRKTKRRMAENNPDLGNQQVESTANPYLINNNFSLDLGLQGSFTQNLRYFGTNKNVLNQRVAQYGAETTVFDFRKMVEWGYSFTKDHNRSKMRARMDGSHEYAPSNTVNAATFKQGVDTMISNYNIIKNAIPASIFFALVLASVGLSQVMTEVLGSLGLGVGPGAIIYATYCYANAEKKVWDVYDRGIQ